MTYEIVVAEGNPDDEFYGTASGNWSNVVGDDNRFETVEEAEEAIEQLRKLGEDWAAGTYRVRVIGERYPL